MEDTTLCISEVSRCAYIREEFLECGFGVWLLGLSCHFQVVSAISTVFVDVCLEKRDGIIGGEAVAWSLPNGSNSGECVRTVELVFLGGLLKIGGDSLLLLMWRSVRDGFTGKGESDVWVVRAGTSRLGNLNGSRMGYLP